VRVNFLKNIWGKFVALKKWQKVIVIILVLSALGSLTSTGNKATTASGNSTSNSTSSNAPATSAPATSAPATSAPATSAPATSAPVSNWYPSGFVQWAQDSNVAFRWASGYSCNVDATNGCYKAIFISQNGCSSEFYAAINLLDASKNVIDYSNATLPTLQPMQRATLEFDDIQGNSKSAEMSQITCQ